MHPDETQNTEAGTEASEYTKSLLVDTEYVYLEFDKSEYDAYGRILAYVWLSPDTTDYENMLNVKLIKEGIADIMTITPNTKYADLFSSFTDDGK